MTDTPAAFLAISHVADLCRRYPGDKVAFHTRVEAEAPLAGFRLQVSLPAGLTLAETHFSPNHGTRQPDLVAADGSSYLVWTVSRDVPAGERFEYVLETVVSPTQVDTRLESEALATTPVEGEAAIRAVEIASVAVQAQGRYLRYLPSIYAEDDLMGRFVMLFESFLAPIEQQTADIHYYFDPRIAPFSLLPWLADWVHLVLDERLPEHRQRQLLGMAAAHYRRRGTRRGLAEILEIYTGVTPHIVEHTANNFRLGPDSRLGSRIALGTVNQPHAFTVTVRFPPGTAGGRSLEEWRRMLAPLIDAEKPAHTTYTLRLETV